MVIYGSLDSDTGDAIGNAFFKKTGIKMESNIKLAESDTTLFILPSNSDLSCSDRMNECHCDRIIS